MFSYRFDGRRLFSINGSWVANVVSAVIRLMECERMKHPMGNISPVLPRIPTKRDPWLMFVWRYSPIIWAGSGSRSVQSPTIPLKSLKNVWIDILWRSLKRRRNQLVHTNGSFLVLTLRKWILNGTYPCIVSNWNCPNGWLANDVCCNGIGKMPTDGNRHHPTMALATVNKKRSAAVLMFELSRNLNETVLSLFLSSIFDGINRQKQFLCWKNQKSTNASCRSQWVSITGHWNMVKTRSSGLALPRMSTFSNERRACRREFADLC